jgi:uroporphyrinogen-III synthase
LARAALAGTRPVIAPLFSPRSAQLFAAIDGALTAPALHLVAISPACAAALPPPLSATIAETPDSGGMLRALLAVMSHPSLAG